MSQLNIHDSMYENIELFHFLQDEVRLLWWVSEENIFLKGVF